MTKSVMALYDTRPEAELAQARLTSQFRTERVQIVGRGDVAQLDDLGLSDEDYRTYRDALARGSTLLVADVDRRQESEGIVALLRDAARAPGSDVSSGALTADSEEVRIPQAHEEVLIGKREVERGGARVRSYTRQQPVQEDVALREEHLEAETRIAGRRLSLEQAEAAGLLKDRVIEVTAMREEAVVEKEAFVREEIVLKKTIAERVETISETIRSTEVEVEELDGPRSPRR